MIVWLFFNLLLVPAKVVDVRKSRGSICANSQICKNWINFCTLKNFKIRYAFNFCAHRWVDLSYQLTQIEQVWQSGGPDGVEILRRAPSWREGRTHSRSVVLHSHEAMSIYMEKYHFFSRVSKLVTWFCAKESWWFVCHMKTHLDLELFWTKIALMSKKG